MADRLLVALDGEEQSWDALDYALREHPEATLIGVCVIDPRRSGSGQEAGNVASGEVWYENAKASAMAVLEDAAELVAEHDIEFSTVTRVGTPATEIVACADEHEVDGIVMGSHGRTGVSRMLLGSVAETVVRRSSVPVTVVR